MLSGIIDPDDGLYARHTRVFETAIKANDLGEIVAVLDKIKDLNKTILVLTLRRLQVKASILRYPLFILRGRQKPG